MPGLLYAARSAGLGLSSSNHRLLRRSGGDEGGRSCSHGRWRFLIGIAQVTIQRLLKRKIELLQWASLGLVVVFGTLGILTNDPRFRMANPTIIYLAIAVVMLKRGWMVRYLPPIAGEHGKPLMIVFGYVWAGLMGLTALANLLVAVAFPNAWPALHRRRPVRLEDRPVRRAICIRPIPRAPPGHR